MNVHGTNETFKMAKKELEEWAHKEKTGSEKNRTFNFLKIQIPIFKSQLQS